MLKSKTAVFSYLLIFIGFVFLSTSSAFEAKQNLSNQYLFINKQLVWIFLSSLVFILFSKISTNVVGKISFLAYLTSIFFLIMLLIPGFSTTIYGANRWLNIGFFSFQPTELCKLSLVLYLSQILSKPTDFGKFFIITFTPILLILLQPNLSSSFLLSAISISLYFLSQNNLGTVIKSSSILIVIFIISIIRSPYKLARLSQNYHSDQLIVSFSSGSLFGKGIGNSTQKFKFLPQISTDSILAIIGEEVGFVGIMSIFIVYYLLIKKIILVGQKTQNDPQKLFCFGTAIWIFYQSAINISVVLGLVPLTGVPLPFISYGGSSLLMLMSAVGIVNNIDISQTNDQKKHRHHR